MAEDDVVLPKWEKIPEGIVPDEKGILFAAILDGVVQQIFSFGANQASLILENPEFVMCNSITRIGMTKEQATSAVIEIPSLTQ